ncbi:hypothetical protein L6E12_31420 [Actinokineospora sp. PR83]|uniref:hypothetical protein n=1 Tax=Actinokineospora sp. PR83 TaxID=2884908 RepID=UPI001F359355|nr:hypothetical protein [Actinokineospora sp. PR83]MCG8920289.1 hypothetical protein [Actinokineospora sp. PR83]
MKPSSEQGNPTGRDVRWAGTTLAAETDTYRAAVSGGDLRPPLPEERVELRPGAAGVVGDLVGTVGGRDFYAVHFPAVDVTVETPVPSDLLTFADSAHRAA